MQGERHVNKNCLNQAKYCRKFISQLFLYYLLCVIFFFAQLKLTLQYIAQRPHIPLSIVRAHPHRTNIAKNEHAGCKPE